MNSYSSLYFTYFKHNTQINTIMMKSPDRAVNRNQNISVKDYRNMDCALRNY